MNYLCENLFDSVREKWDIFVLSKVNRKCIIGKQTVKFCLEGDFDSYKNILKFLDNSIHIEDIFATNKKRDQIVIYHMNLDHFIYKINYTTYDFLNENIYVTLSLGKNEEDKKISRTLNMIINKMRLYNGYLKNRYIIKYRRFIPKDEIEEFRKGCNMDAVYMFFRKYIYDLLTHDFAHLSHP